jgi:anthranilate phosphoribosyltransferase
MPYAQALQALIEGHDLPGSALAAFMQQILAGALSPAQTAALLVALRSKGESVEEITACAQVLRRLAIPVPVSESVTPHLVDIVGTGGDHSRTFNISTAAMFVAAAAGARVSKHGGRSVSSQSGSADVLESLGIAITLSPQAIAQCLNTLGLGFMFAPAHHPAMKQVAPLRKELGVRTLFNLLGPLLNPAQVPHIVMGVFEHKLLVPLAHVLKDLGTHRAWVIHSQDGMDEIAISAPTWVAQLQEGQVREFILNPLDLGITPAPRSSLEVDGPQASKNMILAVLNPAQNPGPPREVVCLNAAAALFVSGVYSSIQESLQAAQAAIRSGHALAKLHAFQTLSQALAHGATSSAS